MLSTPLGQESCLDSCASPFSDTSSHGCSLDWLSSNFRSSIVTPVSTNNLLWVYALLHPLYSSNCDRDEGFDCSVP